MAYTEEEVQAAVEKLIRTTIRRPHDTLGVRRTDITFTDIQEAAAGVFLLYPKAPFYCVYLGSQRVLEQIQGLAKIMEQVLDAVEATGRRVLPIKDLSSLSNARQALGELEVAAGNRTTAFEDIGQVAAYQRFEQNVDRFLSEAGSQIKDKGQVVQTPNEARKVLPGLLGQMKASHEALIQSVTGLANGLENYSKVNLSSLVAKGVIGRSRELIAGHSDTLEAQSEEDRLESIRQVVLDLLASKAVVKTFGSFLAPTSIYPVVGEGLPYSDSTHLAEGALITSQVPSPYLIVPGANELTFEFQPTGGTPTTIRLPYSFVPELTGGVAENATAFGNGFIIGDGAVPARPSGYATPNNNVLKLTIAGVDYVVTLTPSADNSPDDCIPRTAQEVCNDFNAVLPVGYMAEPVFSPLSYSGELNVGSVVGSQAQFSIPGGAGDFSILGITSGYGVTINSGTMDGSYWVIDSLDSSSSFTATMSVGSPVAELGVSVEIGSPFRRVKLFSVNPLTALQNEESLTISSEAGVNTQGWLNLGFPVGVTVTARPSRAKDIATAVNRLTTLVHADVELVLKGEPVFSVVSDPADSSRVTFRKWGGVGDVVFTAGVPFNSITITGATSYGQDSTFQVGDVLVLRTGSSTGLPWGIQTVVGNTITATSTSTAVTESGVVFEVGPDNSPLRWDVLQIDEGPNAGPHGVASVFPSGIDVLLMEPLAQSVDPDTGVALTAAGFLAEEYVLLQSVNRTTSSYLKMYGSALDSFTTFTPPFLEAYGTTRYFKLPQTVSGLEPGDVLGFYESNYNIMSQFTMVLGIEGQILFLSAPIASNLTWLFGSTVLPPVARLMAGHTFDFEGYNVGLSSWLTDEANLAGYYTELNRLLNPLLVNAAPKASEIGDAVQQLGLLLTVLTTNAAEAFDIHDGSLETIVRAYAVPPQPPVDTLLRSYRERGADRAIDLLMSANFTEFFSLTENGASYAGDFQEKLKSVIKDDLPLRKTNQVAALQGRLEGTSTTPDAEYDLSDTEQAQPEVAGDMEDIVS